MQNTLGGETSPYLLQHKDNPVHWQAWGEDAFRQAREQDKPVLLSVGYAACHWCHVMAHESFEDDAIANLMNSMFVNIKVDREERPDVDAIYQAALALTGQHGGWPLTMFLTPEGEPFWGGTYFPASPKYGRPGFPDILRRVAEVYQTDKDAVSKNTAALVDALQKLGQPAEDAQEVALGADILDQVAQRLAKEVVPFLGGIGGAPKFPQSYAFETLWRAWLRTGDEVFFRAVDTTLTQMCQGGIYDHLGGGLARYSTDDRWLVPHFEKMLYDNALFIELLTTVWQSTGNPLYRQRVEETVGWVLREMLGEGGAFAASLDADSEGVEGKFYVWQEAEIDALLGAEAAPFKAAYNVGPGGNWEGSTILNRSHALQLGPPEAEASLAAARQRLLQARDARVRPGWDDKILADWNGMMIAALLHAGSALARPEWIAAAQRAFAFINERMAEGDRLRHAYRDGRIQRAAMLDDYANMARAGVLLYELTGDAQALARAEAWVATVNADYWDDTNGGYFFTAAGATDLVTRMRQCNDNAVPSGNGLMAQVLVRLFHLTGNLAHRQRAETLFQAFSGELLRNFFPLTTYLNSFELLLRPLQVVIVGARGEPEAEALLSAVNAVCLPNRILQTVADPAALPPLHPAHAKTQLEGRATAYVCLGETCSLPLAEPEALRAELQQHSR